MRLGRFLIYAALLGMTACSSSSSHRPKYLGYEANTEGVPGFVNGYKVAPTVKLGQAYEVDGETYVPHYDHDYVEEGMASWYGPGFHGGKTANGEEFDKHDMTAAHRTLPLPSIVKVTLLSSGKSAYVRVNDRGPFAKSRIIDLSYGAADAVGLIGPGTGRVRVEYMPEESQKFADLLAQGREPKSIDLASEVIGQHSTNYAYAKKNPSSTLLSHLNPVSTASAAEPASIAMASPSDDRIETRDLTPAAAPVPASASVPAPSAASVPAAASAPSATAMVPTPSPANIIVTPSTTQAAAMSSSPAVTPVSKTPEAAPIAATAAPSTNLAGPVYVQLGAFLQSANAEKLRKKVAPIGTAFISPLTAPDGAILYRVRMGPYSHVEESSRVLAQLNGVGITPKLVTK